ncbi:uncharacterized protein LOC129216322 [Uloborus diversus]|uniref:uncharacterized protein LOC129216322 n=1 Tax=Uloborus diversus TaxID=327109 RepID=UPI00240A1554|nr:uncharacterized protein LOC129216322 [Uloborus diversus]
MGLWFDSSERLVLQTWLEKYLSWAPSDYDESWRDGCLLSILLNKLQPGCIPDAEKLDSEYSLRNVYHAFDVLEEYFNIKPDLSPEEIVTCANESEKKLYDLLSQLKQATDIRTDSEETIPKAEILEKTESDENALNKHCIAKGTGLVVGFVERMTHFIVFFANLADLDVVVDIKGPSETVCSERITKRSPKKRCSTTDIMEYNSSPILRSVSNPEDRICYEEEKELISRTIPLEYEILPNQINFAYKPLYKGPHKISVLWHGLHVFGSPYTVTVEDPCQVTNANNSAYIKPALKSFNSEDKSVTKKPSVRFQDSKEKFGKTLKKRVLRYIVKIDGKDVAVDTNNTDSLATELLKMDYDYDNNFSLCRRNSWGFTGDAERKVSVIRQFCVDVDVMEAQSKHKRSRSLVLDRENSTTSRSDSLDDLRLNCIKENSIKKAQDCYSSEDTFPHMDFDSNENLVEEDANIEFENLDSPIAESSSFAERHMNSEEVKEELIVKSCCIKDESKIKTNDLISSFSAETLPPKAENLNEDPKKSSNVSCENINEQLSEPENISKQIETEVADFNYYNIQPSLEDLTDIANVELGNGDDVNKYDHRNPSSSSSEYMNNTKPLCDASIPSPTFISRGINHRTSNEICLTSLHCCNKFEKKLNKIGVKELPRNSATTSSTHQSDNVVENKKAHPIKTHSLLSIGHYNFKQFNPPSEIEASFRVKNRILEWEATISGEHQDLKSSKSVPITEVLDTVDVKAKLSFWESAYKKEETNSLENVELHRHLLKGSLSSDESKDNSGDIPFDNTDELSNNILWNLFHTTEIHSLRVTGQKKKINEKKFVAAKTSSCLNHVSNKKLEVEFQNVIGGPSNKQTRSFSDSIIDTSKRSEKDNFDIPLETSDNIYSSNDMDLITYSSDDESSAPDHLRLSTEDEYIDDEISESTPMFWGELSLLTTQKHSNSSSDAECSEFLDPEYFRQRYLNSNFNPSECKIFGISNYYGYVAVKNRFQVLTKDAGTGNLSVSVQGFGEHDVSLVCVTYRKKDIYDVTYQVMTAGYYLISVRWMDCHIPGSPFVCKVTF